MFHNSGDTGERKESMVSVALGVPHFMQQEKYFFRTHKNLRSIGTRTVGWWGTSGIFIQQQSVICNIYPHDYTSVTLNRMRCSYFSYIVALIIC